MTSQGGFRKLMSGWPHLVPATVVSIILLAISCYGAPPQRQAGAGSKRESRPNREAVRNAEQRLADLGYWTGPIDGTFDPASRQALIAFQKVEGRHSTGLLTADEIAALNRASRPQPLEGGVAHVEVDLRRQVLFIVDDSGAVSHILPVSTGSGEEFTSEGWTRRAITPTGRLRIQRKLEGWRKGPLGPIYYPNYIAGGVAIHGLAQVPTTPTSHGCIRIPLFAAKEFSEMTPVGTIAIIHDGMTAAR